VSSRQPPAHGGSSLADSTLKMEATHSSETLDRTRSTRRHIPEDGILHSHRRENLKSYEFSLIQQSNLVHFGINDNVIYIHLRPKYYGQGQQKQS
jgi:hypothetical protein